MLNSLPAASRPSIPDPAEIAEDRRDARRFQAADRCERLVGEVDAAMEWLVAQLEAFDRGAADNLDPTTARVFLQGAAINLREMRQDMRLLKSAQGVLKSFL